MVDRIPMRRVARGLVVAAFMVCGVSALMTIEPPSARADGVQCLQVAYEPGPWGSAPGLYKSCHDENGFHVPPPDGSNDAWDYMHRPR